jgi:N-acetyl-gamma-glutamyl-phosphate reductase
MDRLQVTVFGAGGLAAGELLRLLSLHPAKCKITAVSKSQAGKPAHEVHRSLVHLPHIDLVDMPVQSAVAGADVVFLALPHGQSQTVIDEVFQSAPGLIIDLANDFRINDPARYNAFFGDHQAPKALSQFTYGLPEAFSDTIAKSKFIANPGCFATAAQLLLLPLAAENLLPECTSVFAATGSTGSGIIPKTTTHHPFRDGNMFAYKMLAHQHEPEIAQTLSKVSGANNQVRLLAHSAPIVRGIYATTHIQDPRFKNLDLPKHYKSYYEDQPFVFVQDAPPQVAEVAATNFVHIGLAQNQDEVQISIALDNLVKGAAGTAIQNMNLALGLDETAGLTHPGAFPC